MHALIRAILAPYEVQATNAHARFTIQGIDLPLSGGSITSFALLLNEFETNAAKYGSLSTPHGTVAITCNAQGNMPHMRWKEAGGPPARANGGGFGSMLVEATVRQLGGEIAREWTAEGLMIKLSAALDRCTARPS